MKVYITGMGAITPVGNTVEDSWNAILNGQHGIDQVAAFDAVNYRTKLAAEITTDLVSYAKTLSSDIKINSIEESAKLSVIATHMALENADLNENELLANLNTGIVLGTGFGGILFAEEPIKRVMATMPYQPKGASPFTVPFVEPNFVVSLLSRIWNLQGIQYSVCTACSSGTHAIGQAMSLIKAGRADMIVTGGMEKTVAPITYAGFDQLRAMSTSTDKDNACTPFSAERSGFILGEGAATLILESEASVEKRGIEPIAEVVGYGASGGAYHMVKPKPNGNDIIASMQNAINDAGITIHDIGAINAHGTSTRLNDVTELAAMNHFFSEKEKPLILAANKANIGHCVGAAGAIEAVFSAKTLSTGVHAPLYNFQPDESLDYSNVFIPNSMYEDNSIDYLLSNSFGFGNNNATLILKKV